jgi:uncharacterized coiled-coil protein SlyX
MGLFWDLIQQSQISQQERRSVGLEQRVADLEAELDRTRELLRSLIERLEKHFGMDLDQNGRIGR